MSTRELIDQELAVLPETLQLEVYDFLRFLKQKSEVEERFNGLEISRSAFGKDWDTPEEDLAWASL